MSVADDFDTLVAQADNAAIIVTTAANDELAGCLVGFHSQCSIEPRRYAVWISKANHTYRTALFAEHLAVHFLTTDQMHLAELFGTQSSDDVDKFDRCDWTMADEEVPLLDGCRNRFVARRATVIDDGSDHVCFVLDPKRSESSDSGTPLRLSQIDDLEPGHDAEDRPDISADLRENDDRTQ